MSTLRKKLGTLDRIHWRAGAMNSDVETVRAVVESTGFFSASEADVAVELVQERLMRGQDSGYEFVFAEVGESVVGYACYGSIACTLASFDLYWIVVHSDWQSKGLGRLILEQAEQSIRSIRGRRVYIETSGRDQYTPTRAFYRRCGYQQEAFLKDFYAPGDGKVIFVKEMGG